MRGCESHFWDKTARKYSEKPVPSEEIYQTKLQKTREYLQPDSAVLEFGCGTGTTSLLHAPYVKRVDAYDFSSEMIKIASEKKREQNIANIHFHIGAVEEIDFKSEYYDLIMGHSVLHLTFGNQEILNNIFKALKPGGVFVSSTGCLKDLAAPIRVLLHFLLPILKLFGAAPRPNIFSADELIEQHKRAGFSIEHEWRFKRGEIFLVAKK